LTSRSAHPRRHGDDVSRQQQIPGHTRTSFSVRIAQTILQEKAAELKKNLFFYVDRYDIIPVMNSGGGPAMKNKITVSIADQEYTLVATEDEGYMQKVAQHVDAKVREVLDGAKVSLVDGAVLAALNVADEYFKEVEAAENLRRQLKEYLEEATKMKLELSEAKREIFKLQNKK
jgi:cell division protein ZapA